MSYGLEALREILILIGAGFVIGMFIAVLLAVIDSIKDKISDKKRRYQIEHRFDKPPTAKCYCIDCTHYDEEYRECYHFMVNHIYDDYFCSEATPRKEVKNNVD